MEESVFLKGQSVDLALKNPVIAASGTFGNGVEFAPYGDLAALGGFVVKGISLESRSGNRMPRIWETPSGMLNSIGLQNDGADNFIRNILPALPCSETAVIVNLYATSVEDFGKLAKKLGSIEEIAALEVNVSCPNVREGGIAFGASGTSVEAVTYNVRKNAPDKHIIVKLSPNVTDIGNIAKSAENGGADSISCINTILAMAVDLKTRRPGLANVLGGLSGPAIKPVALRCVWQVFNSVKIPVIGIGGIVSVEDVLEFILTGANAVQIGTANFMRPDICFSLVRELPEAMRKYNIEKIEDFCGKLILD